MRSIQDIQIYTYFFNNTDIKKFLLLNEPYLYFS